MSSENNDPLIQRPAGGLDDTSMPSSLLPDLLRRLGLEKPQEQEPQIVELLAGLKDPAWPVRARAVCQLGKLGEGAPREILLAALDDAHISVRANAVFALGMLGKHVPVERLVQVLLSDSEWQVRESAALALARLGKQAPETPLLAALSDADASVRAAAYQALEQSHPGLLDLIARDRQTAAAQTVARKSWRPLRPMFKRHPSANAHICKEEKNMYDNDSPVEITSYTDGKAHQPELPQRRGHRVWRAIGLSVAVVVVMVNLLAWTILTHVHRPGAQIGSSVQRDSNSPTAVVTPHPDPGKTLFVYSPKGLETDFMSVGWSSTGKYISVSGMDIKLLDASTGQAVKTLSSSPSSIWTSWSPDGTRLVASGGTVQVLDIQTGNVLVTYTPQAAQASLMTPHGNPMARLSGGNMVYDSAWSPDGKLIASAVNGNAYGYNVQVWNASTGANVRTLEIKPGANYNDYIDHVSWSPDGKYLAASSPNNGVIVWDTTTWQKVYMQHGALGLAWSPQGDLIASANSSGLVQVWQATTGAVQFSFQGQSNHTSVAALAWSPDGKYLAASNTEVCVWDVANDKLHYDYTGHGKADKQNVFVIKSLAWSPDSTQIASLESGMHLITSNSGTPLNSVRVWIAA